jgi:hypothetical protein
MAISKDYIPSGNDEFNIWQKNLISTTSPKVAAWGILAADFDAVKAERDIFIPLYDKISNKGSRTPSDIEAYNTERVKYEKMLRQFVGQWLSNNSQVTDAERVTLAITVKEGSRTPRPAITTSPSIKLKALEGGRIKLTCRVESDSSRASMHPDADAVEVRYIVGTATPATPADCPNMTIKSKATFTLNMNLADAGKKLYCFTRWINTSDETKSGPWNTVSSVVISD